ncbi:hypothetical protein [Bosea sp. 685]|nr:hypothetical protein [Bosea sp. 685]WNJ92510.1 hypothetical protein RMR04_09515 [Bosea sp. 685]
MRAKLFDQDTYRWRVDREGCIRLGSMVAILAPTLYLVNLLD